MASKRSIQKERYWRDVLKQQANSGLSVRQFCGRGKISEGSFYFWRQKLRTAGTRAESAKQVAAPERSPFVPLKLTDAPGFGESPRMLELVHPQGYLIRIAGEVHVATLRQVIDVLDDRSRA